MGGEFMIMYLFLLQIITTTIGLGVVEGYNNDDCTISKCGKNGPPIRFPFRLKPNQPKHCGYSGFELSCNHLNQTVLQLSVALNLVVKKIDYLYREIHIQDPGNCFPAQLLTLNLSATPFSNGESNALFNCSPAQRNWGTFVPCLSGPGYQVYVVEYGRISEELVSCNKIANFSLSYFAVRDQLLHGGLWLHWDEPDCYTCESQDKWCRSMNFNDTDQLECVNFPKTPNAAAKKRLYAVLGAIILLMVAAGVFYIYNSQKTKKEDQIKVKRFLEDYKALRPSRYSFADIKKFTNNFKDKLGVGAYGTVYKGKLSHEIFVAIKVLESSMENGEEFIKEVGTMAVIHHVNVVRLVGFCADGINRALVYEFLPNESLEKFISSQTQNNTTFLGWEKLQDISLGIARGIEYLHDGCDHQILHFDIKPHNVLLDHNFNPKIADFGLAKLCPKNQSKVSMTNARGTMGYIAPEVFSRNFGNVSYKSDIYSFGMLLLKMVGERTDVDLKVQNASQTYFPEWVYDRLCQGEELKIKTEVEEDTEIVRKLTIVGLYCIQWSPLDRPPMKTVIQMLEGNGNALPIPPNPFSSIGRNSSTKNNPARIINRALEVIDEV